MPANRPTPRPSAGWLLIVLIVGFLLIPTVSAESQILSDEDFDVDYYTVGGGYTATGGPQEQCLRIYNIENYTTLSMVYWKTTFKSSADMAFFQKHPSLSEPVTFSYGGNQIGNGQVSYNVLYNKETPIGIQFWVDIENWDVSGLKGQKNILVNPIADSQIFTHKLHIDGAFDTPPTAANPIQFGGVTGWYVFAGTYITHSSYSWSNAIEITDQYVYLTRYGNISIFTVVSDLGTYTDHSTHDIHYPYMGGGTWSVTNSQGTIFTGDLGVTSQGPTNTNATATVYVRNSQTGALISGAHILIEGTPTTSDWIEYVNETLPSGTAQYSLPGMPHQYRIVATADGYTYPAASQYFRAGETVIVNMEPATEAPVNESNTYLEVYTRDTSANPIPGAIVEVDDQWLYTNNNGYARFEVAVNSTYPYTVSKSGYMTITGSATVADADHYTVNVVLGAGTVPTLTPGPTVPGATPTPDTRTNEQKGQEVIDLLADFALPIAILAILATLSGLLNMMMPRRR